MRDSTSLRSSLLNTVLEFMATHSVYGSLLHNLLSLAFKSSVANTPKPRDAMQSLIDGLRAFVKEKMSPLDGTAHSYEHVDRVLKIATFLAKEEKADLELVQVGALLHDLGRALGQPHNEIGAKLAREALERMNYPKERSEKVIKIILYHPLDFKERLETLEEKIVWDADKIDLLGAVGIARGFHWCGEKRFEDAVRLAFEVYTPIFTMLNTTTARRIARKRNEETMSFLSALEKEISVTDLGTT
jgi:putative nucleotidyltransferase with HDIG domain